MIPSFRRYYRFLEMVNRRVEPSATTSKEELDEQLPSLDTSDDTSLVAVKEVFTLGDSDQEGQLGSKETKEILGCAHDVMKSQDKSIAGKISACQVCLQFFSIANTHFLKACLVSSKL